LFLFIIKPNFFKKKENVNSYLKACPKFGIPRRDIFTTIDLFEGKGMLMVLTNIDRLQKIHAQYGESLAEKVRSGELALSADEKQKTTTQSLRFSSSMPHASITSVLSQVQESPVRQPADVSSLDDDVAAMQYFKYDPLLERQAKKWIEVNFMLQFFFFFFFFPSFFFPTVQLKRM